MVEVPIKRAMIEAAECVALLADAAKFSMAGLVRVCDADALDHIVTDAPVPAACRAGHRRYGNRGHHRMKLTIVGGGGFRVPLVYGALLEKAERLGLDEVVLHDIDATRLERIAAVLDGLAAEHGSRLPFRVEHRPRRRRGRRRLRLLARSASASSRGAWSTRASRSGLGVLGQETTGPGGICFALRTIPAMVALAQTMAERAPKAWLINFTNPAGMVTEAVQQVLGERAVGVCDSPSGHVPPGRPALGRDPSELWFDYYGLNHLGWLRGVRDRGGELLGGLLEDDERLAGFEEGRLFGGDWLRSLGMIPNEYLYYFYYAADTVNAIRESPTSRGAFLLEQQRRFYVARRRGRRPPRSPPGARPATIASARTWPRRARAAGRRRRPRPRRQQRLRERGDGRAGGDRAQHARRADPQHRQPHEPAVPRRARGGRGAGGRRARRAGAGRERRGARPTRAALVEPMKDVERTTIDAALTGSRSLAVKALALHPLVPSVTVAREIFDGYRARLPALEEAFPA